MSTGNLTKHLGRSKLRQQMLVLALMLTLGLGLWVLASDQQFARLSFLTLSVLPTTSPTGGSVSDVDPYLPLSSRASLPLPTCPAALAYVDGASPRTTNFRPVNRLSRLVHLVCDP